MPELTTPPSPASPMEKQGALAALAALAHETRLDVFRLLVVAGPDGLAAGDIAERLGVQAATLSHHLKELKSARVVHCRREGRSLIYSADFNAMGDLIGFLSENCCASGGCPTRADPGQLNADPGQLSVDRD